MIKLCYKEYDYDLNLKAADKFANDTGFDLQTVFMKYIVAASKTVGMGVAERLVYFAELYPRDIACRALHAVISQECDGVSLSEIEDATFRVGWLANNKDTDMQEPWPLVMVTTAMEINTFVMSGDFIKKMDTSESAATH